MLKRCAIVAALAAAGCFNEPESAYRTVSPDMRVYASGKSLSSLDGVAASWRADIDYLNLDRNRLENVDAIARFTSLKWLRLNSNRLSDLPDLGALVSLRRIYLRDNRFEKVPQTLKNLPALTDIDLSSNPISEIPDWLAAKKNLENLSFSNTRLAKLPDDISAWRSLKSLQLGDLDLPAGEMARIRAALPDTAIVF